ncbi:DUF2087 domain-containing protein [Kurthia sibirica]|uniref:Transcriptional regulator n=1 Tax=Kurthia sibirica TaxID=202750 RepID=A0A2U3AJR0_9BACL|nr:DUF2087 domain-containing protein [Kurthia sibirica]PWI24786.1 transcriptional regulator [Kurthia sibirica]GEK34889.1 transcriptional regulator [Kurthia sibirica]
MKYDMDEVKVEQLIKGYQEQEEYFSCLLCNHKIEKGIVYMKEDIMYEAEKFMKLHITIKHDSVFTFFIEQNKKMTGLTEHQSNLMTAFYEGKGDKEIQAELEIGSISTIRQHRFALREKEKQAKVFLTLMHLLKQRENNADDFVPVHQTATMIDDRYNVTEKEQQEILEKNFPEGLNGKLARFPKKQKHKIIVLRAIAQNFEEGRKYSEKELNAIIAEKFDDFVTLRRYLIEYGFVDRLADGSEYWLK